MILDQSVVDDYTGGMTYKALSAKHGQSIPTIRGRLRKMGVKRVVLVSPKKVGFSPERLAALVGDYHGGINIIELSAKYGLSTTTLYQVFKEHGVGSRYQFTEQDVVNDYVVDKLTFRQIGKKRHTSWNTIGPILEKHGIKLRNNRTYAVDETVFDTIDEKAAYFLGLFCADGWITGQYSGREYYAVGIGLDKHDIELLDQIRTWLKTDRPYYKQRGMLALSITNRAIWRKMHELGLGHKKFNRLSIPRCVTGNLLRHFVRGYFDGDGSISAGRGQLRWRICGYEPFMLEMVDAIEKATGIKTFYRFVQFNSDGTKFGEVGFYGNLRAPALFNWMYDGSTIKMKRKHDRYVNHQAVYAKWKADGRKVEIGRLL